MIISGIEAEGFRNLSSLRAEFDGGVNVIVGPNGQGKTNLLEALYYMTTGRSFRARSEAEMISFTADGALVTMRARLSDREKEIKLELSRQSRRKIWINGVRRKNMDEISEHAAAVLFCPDDLHIVKAGSSPRRRLMDSALSQIYPRYSSDLQAYGKTLEGKSRILRDSAEKPRLLELIDEYDDRLAALGARLIHYRARYARRLSEIASGIHRDFSGGKEELEIIYRTVSVIDDPSMRPAELYPLLLDRLRQLRAAERAAMQCLSGAHKDDLEILINGRSAKKFASQGQTRTAALSVKLAERDIFTQVMGEPPILLLDDVLSELDEDRQSFILNRSARGQVFITCCSLDRSSGFAERILPIYEGRVDGESV
ncbi:MAG: DNA replication/repair protein RecF [Oscillospiraceae bacterium]|nr:DNA replication/repair protein RecF [Oscillospiraceae bacterium]